ERRDDLQVEDVLLGVGVRVRDDRARELLKAGARDPDLLHERADIAAVRDLRAAERLVDRVEAQERDQVLGERADRGRDLVARRAGYAPTAVRRVRLRGDREHLVRGR